MWARYSPGISVSGRYEIAAFIPGRHSTTQNARYKIAGVKGSSTELIVNVDQSRYSNDWVPLGVFELQSTTVGAGTVSLNDLTGESGREIAFDAIRFRQLIASPPASG
ncbi:MAG: hypothetical protein JNM70_17265, partial [Anaerolineae bacterium]|nr:hypothetical protein [Anaerolineae bacterium]